MSGDAEETWLPFSFEKERWMTSFSYWPTFLVLAQFFSYWPTYSVLAEFFIRMMRADLFIQIPILMKLINKSRLLARSRRNTFFVLPRSATDEP